MEARAEAARWREEHRLASDGRVLESKEEHGSRVQAVRYAYDEGRRLTEARYTPAGTVSRYVYSEDGRTIELVLERSGHEPERLTRWTLDSEGRLESLESFRDDVATRTVRYVRDDRGRVVEERELEGQRLVILRRCSHDAEGRPSACTWDYGGDGSPEMRSTYRYDSNYGPYPCEPDFLIPAPSEP